MDSRLIKALDREILKDKKDIELHKNSLIKSIKMGEWDNINVIESYNKTPSKWKVLKNKIIKIFKTF